MNVNDFRNKAFAWMKAIKEGSRVPPPVPEQGLPEEGRSSEVKQLHRQMSDLQENLQRDVESRGSGRSLCMWIPCNGLISRPETKRFGS